MDFKHIDQLLEKYWAGETSLAEEAQLRQFFSKDDVPERYAKVQPLFQFFKGEQEAFLHGDFDERLSSKLRAVDNQRPRRPALLVYIKRATAVAAILAGVLFFYPKGDDISPTERKEAQLAYAEAKAALLLISSKLNKGANKAESGIVQVKKATNMIRE